MIRLLQLFGFVIVLSIISSSLTGVVAMYVGEFFYGGNFEWSWEYVRKILSGGLFMASVFCFLGLMRYSTSMGLWILIFLVISLIFEVKNPSKAEANTSLLMMNHDMGAALDIGGMVDSRYADAQYGEALLYVTLRANSWSPELVNKYRLSLLSHGWSQRALAEDNLSLCKNGALATIRLSPGVDISCGLQCEVYGFSMKYNGDTIELCQ